MNLSRFRAGLLMTVLSGVVLASPVFDTHAQGGDTPKVGDIVVDGLGFEMVYVPAGTFEMGIQQETLEALVGPLDEVAVEGFTDIGVFEAYVEEWVEDRFLPYSTSSPFPRDGSLDTARVARGGTYYHYEYALATFVRYGYGYYHGSLFTGFRCARLSDPRLD